jgi:hypothetical protein
MDDQPLGNGSPQKDLKVLYLFSSPEGDIPLDTRTLDQPFLLAPSEPHPHMTLGHYFDSIHRFVLVENWDTFFTVLNESTKNKIDPADIRQVLIRSEKHGTLYHLASIEVLAPGFQRKFALSTGVSQRGKDWLNHEFDVIRGLNHATNLPYLPRVYFKGDVTCRTENGDETMVMSLAEWFGDYHEWHISLNENEESLQILIWDQNKGYGYASKQECHEIYREASKILTLYYDTRTYSQIYPWHHGAGDFVVKREQGKIKVRLTTARKYEPVMVFNEEAQINPLVALIYFFLNLTLQMRLDKLDGTGEVTWAEDWVLLPVIEGFLDAFRIKEKQESDHPIEVNDLITLLKGFSREEFQNVLNSLMDLHRHQDPEAYRIIQAQLKDHAKAVYEGLRAERVAHRA